MVAVAPSPSPKTSHPTRVRGLKQGKGVAVGVQPLVAPHAGAWIETCNSCTFCVWLRVAPHAGAWIETVPGVAAAPVELVAPHAGAWIETCSTRLWILSGAKSHPTRVRGLKQRSRAATDGPRRSHPTRVRGLKLVTGPFMVQAQPSHPTRVRGLKL